MGGYIEWAPKVKAWVNGVHLDENTVNQVVTLASMPEVAAVSVMPDCHLGKGSTIGSVIITKKVILPATVGVDLGCGVNAIRTSLTASDLPESVDGLRSEIERAVPHGRTNNGQSGDRGAWSNVPASVTTIWRDRLENRFNSILEKHPKIGSHNALTHCGTQGGGNHFLEVCIDEEQRVWIMLHSGSRGVGNRIGTYFINKAKEEMARIHRGLPDQDLSFLEKGTDVFDDYIEAMTWAQDFALTNRQIMMNRALMALRDHKGIPSFTTDKVAVECHHNYVSFERHLGDDVMVTRKGAVNAEKGKLGIIPTSMGTGSYIVEGLGNADSFNSCSHGAGRTMSRTQAKKVITMDEHKEAMKGISARTDEAVLDESPRAYKDPQAVMAAQADLVTIKHTLKQVLCVKG